MTVSDEVTIQADDRSVVALNRGGAEALAARKAARGARPRMTLNSLEARSLEDLQQAELKRLGDLPDDKHLGHIARIAAMRVLVGFLTGQVVPKTTAEWMKVAEVSHRIAMAEQAASGTEAPPSHEEARDELAAIAKQVRQQTGTDG